MEQVQKTNQERIDGIANIGDVVAHAYGDRMNLAEFKDALVNNVEALDIASELSHVLTEIEGSKNDLVEANLQGRLPSLIANLNALVPGSERSNLGQGEVDDEGNHQYSISQDSQG